MKASLFCALFFLSSSVFFTVQLYKTKDIPFLNDAFEGVTAVFGIEPDLVMKKIEKKEKVFTVEKAKVEIQVIEPVLVSKDQPQEAQVNEKPVEKIFENIADTQSKKPDSSVLVSASTSKVEDIFGSLVSEENVTSTDENLEGSEKIFFSALVHSTKAIVNDGTIQLRLAESVTIKGRSYPKSFVFEATTVIFDGKYVLYTNLFGVESKNYDSNSEGSKITEKHLGRKGAITLSEGESVKMGYN